MEKPLISIITIVFNGEDLIENTIKSVINQTYQNIEYVVIDGLSRDLTVDIIKKYEKNITYWSSEKDGGIFDAMNKGLDKVTGDWVIFMNAGDLFYNENVLSEIFNKPYNDKISLLYGNVNLYDSDDNYNVVSKTNRIKINLNAICHQSVFIRRAVHPKFDLGYKLSADHNLIYDFVKRNECMHVPVYVSRILIGGVSSDLKATRNEKLRITMAKGGLIDKSFAIGFYLYGALKQHTKSMLLNFFPAKIFQQIRALKNKIEQI